MLGAGSGFSGLPAELVEGLSPAHRKQIDAEIDAFLLTSPFAKGELPAGSKI